MKDNLVKFLTRELSEHELAKIIMEIDHSLDEKQALLVAKNYLNSDNFIWFNRDYRKWYMDIYPITHFEQ